MLYSDPRRAVLLVLYVGQGGRARNGRGAGLGLAAMSRVASDLLSDATLL